MDISEIKANFDYLYENNIKPQLPLLEIERIKLYRRYCISFVLAMISFVIFFSLLCFYERVPEDIFPYLLIFSLLFLIFSLVLLYRNNKLVNEFRLKLKKLILKDLLMIFGDWQISNKNILSLEEIQALNFFKRSSTKTDDDCINVNINGVYVNIVETRLTHVEGSGKSSHTVTDFDGIILKVQSDANFYGITTVTPIMDTNVQMDSFERLLNKRIDINFFKPQNNYSAFEKVNANSDFFNKIFDIYSNAPSEVPYLITPSFEEKIFHIIKKFNSVIRFAFKDGYLYIFLQSIELKGHKKGAKGFFEVGYINKTLYDKSIYENLFNELAAINSVLEKLTTRE